MKLLDHFLPRIFLATLDPRSNCQVARPQASALHNHRFATADRDVCAWSAV